MWTSLVGVSARADDPQITAGDITQAVRKAVVRLEAGGPDYRRQRECFSCHHQALPVIAAAAARRHGFDIDEENFRKQVLWTIEHLNRGKKGYLAGRGQGGQVTTAGYALWTLQAGGWEPDETTAAVAHYLLNRHKQRGHWRTTARRPPSEASDFTTTYVAIRGLAAFGTQQQQQQIQQRRRDALAWLLQSDAPETEDRVFRLRALHELGAEPDALQAAAESLIQQQRDDGGWAQLPAADVSKSLESATAPLAKGRQGGREAHPGETSDAYATGTVLVALHETQALMPSDPVYQRGLRYLLQTQCDDGSWHVVSRSRPFQTYFESGFPHGKDQFISIAATSWATLAMLAALPEELQPGP